MKKSARILVAAILIMAMCVSSVFAASATVTAVDAKGKTGDEVTVAVKVSDVAFSTYSIELKYDKSALELTKMAKGDFNGSYSLTKATGKAGFYATDDEGNSVNVTGGGVLFTATFKILAKNGKYDVNPSIQQMKDYENVSVGAVAKAGTVTVEVPHTHTYGDWQFDKNNHWKECSCGDVKDKAGHDFDWETVREATETEKGLKKGVCSVCGYETEKEIDKLTPEKEDPTKPADKPEDTAKTGDESNMMVFGIVALAAAAVATGTVFTRRRSAK